MITYSPLQGTELFGLQVKDDNTIVYREWAPNAVQASLIGDFSKL
jgi:1,4-alpha-glucan branching enzyme